MKWSTERDALIAQTMAFVQSVTGPKPDGTAEVFPARPLTGRPAPAEPVATKDPVSSPVQTGQPSKSLSVTTLAQSEIRKEVQTRVAAFQAHQHRFHREREAYFNSVLTKARCGVEAGPKGPPA